MARRIQRLQTLLPSPTSITARILLLSTLLSSSSLALADPTWYVGAQLDLNRASIKDNQANSTIGTGANFSGTIDGALRDRSSNDYSAGVGFVVGRDYGNWQLELDTVWTYRTDWDIAASTPSINTITNIFSDLETTMLLLNAKRRWQINDKWAWHAGLGLGIAHQSYDASYIERAVPGTQAERKFSANGSSTETVYSAFAGISRDFNIGKQNMRATAKTRWLSVRDLESPKFRERPGQVSAELHGLDLQLQLIWQF